MIFRAIVMKELATRMSEMQDNSGDLNGSLQHTIL